MLVFQGHSSGAFNIQVNDSAAFGAFGEVNGFFGYLPYRTFLYEFVAMAFWAFGHHESPCVYYRQGGFDFLV
jgi:hypothetical protein